MRDDREALNPIAMLGGAAFVVAVVAMALSLFPWDVESGEKTATQDVVVVRPPPVADMPPPAMASISSQSPSSISAREMISPAAAYKVVAHVRQAYLLISTEK
jgi:hypothetical protein